jgi:hypothetical protein
MARRRKEVRFLSTSWKLKAKRIANDMGEVSQGPVPCENPPRAKGAKGDF